MQILQLSSLWISLLVLYHGHLLKRMTSCYIIRRDMFDVFKASEYSIYDTSETKLLYRIESEYSMFPKLKLIRYPQRRINGRLKSRFHFPFYKGDFSIIDTRKNRWIFGTMQRNFLLNQSSFDINWYGQRISLNLDTFSSTHKFKDSNGILQAEYQMDYVSSFRAARYNLTIYTDTYLDGLYILGFAGYQYRNGGSIKGRH